MKMSERASDVAPCEGRSVYVASCVNLCGEEWAMRSMPQADEFDYGAATLFLPNCVSSAGPVRAQSMRGHAWAPFLCEGGDPLSGPSIVPLLLISPIATLHPCRPP